MNRRMNRAAAVLFAVLTMFMVSAADAEGEFSRLDALIGVEETMLAKGREIHVVRSEEDSWTNVRYIVTGRLAPGLDGTQTYGRVYRTDNALNVTWNDLFNDPDSAAEHLETVVANLTEENDYAAYRQTTPIPRDNFVIENGVMTVWYPADQLSHFSGDSAGYCFYPQDLQAFWSDSLPLLRQGDPLSVLTGKNFPEPLAEAVIGKSIAELADTWKMIDVPDTLNDAVCYRFELPAIQGGLILAAPGETDIQTARVAGIFTRNFDLYGIRTGSTGREEAEAILGKPDLVCTKEEAGLYDRLPAGETLYWNGEDCRLELHFSEGILYSIALLSDSI